MISRHVYPQVPPKVEYSLTKKGQSLIPVLDVICNWGLANVPEHELKEILCTD
ncbi:winged helix-turn-helix transcriptional regulator [Vagococcus salmoninarum]|uniref:winged helix-turn-helix transcriptional regulator n=1 Tax=Vagococcus salmoninarum TaxID=2739 RepID=UPI003F68B331